jgi:hypothetical protein
MGTTNLVVAAGPASQIFAQGEDSIIWPQQATPQVSSLTVPANSSVTFYYVLGTWYVIAEGAVAASSVNSGFTAAGQIRVGTGGGTGELLGAGVAGQVLTVGGADPSGLKWLGPMIVSGETATPQFGPPSTGFWSQGQLFLDASNTLWGCTVSGTSGTWVAINPSHLSANPAGRMYQSGGTNTLIASPVQITNMVSDFVRGGTVVASNGLIVPVAGVYSISWGIDLAATAVGPNLSGYASLYVNGVAILRTGSGPPTGTFEVWDKTDLLPLAAGDTLTMYGTVPSNAIATQATRSTGLSAVLVSS